MNICIKGGQVWDKTGFVERPLFITKGILSIMDEEKKAFTPQMQYQ